MRRSGREEPHPVGVRGDLQRRVAPEVAREDFFMQPPSRWDSSFTTLPLIRSLYSAGPRAPNADGFEQLPSQRKRGIRGDAMDQRRFTSPGVRPERRTPSGRSGADFACGGFLPLPRLSSGGCRFSTDTTRAGTMTLFPGAQVYVRGYR